MAEKEKPNILVLGGVGFVGRNVVQWLVAHNAAKHIRVVDKVLPSVAFLGKEHKEAFANGMVKFKQGNAQSTGASVSSLSFTSQISSPLLFISPSPPLVSLEKMFKLKNGEKVDYVINLASETKYGEEPIVRSPSHSHPFTSLSLFFSLSTF
jgi:nucleoside-diphosphate-sugar epimerase